MVLLLREQVDYHQRTQRHEPECGFLSKTRYLKFHSNIVFIAVQKDAKQFLL